MDKANHNLPCPNVGCGDGKGLSMDTARADRFTHAMFRIARVVHSLGAAAETFPKGDVIPGCLDARSTVRAFAGDLEADINLLFQMIENEEAPEASAEGRA